MSNPLFQMLGNQIPNMGGIEKIFQAFQQFKNQFRGDARQQVQEMLNSGRISQNQFNQAVQIAQQFQKMIGGK